MEGVRAAFAQFDNDVRSDRTRAGMKAALELGRWVFLAPIGYLNAPRATGKSLMHDPARAPLVRRAFEDYTTGRYTKEQLLKLAMTWGLTNRRGKPLTSQAIGMLLRNRLYAGIVDVPEYGVRGKRGDFEPLISEELFYQVQAVLSGRFQSTAPRQRAHPDFPLRGFVRCKSCGRGITGSWSKGRSDYYAYYHCRPGCRAVNVTKAKIEGLFADQLALLQPTPWLHAFTEGVGAADLVLTLARIDRHSSQLDALDVEGILAFAERVLPRAADLWVQAALDQRQRFQQLFFPNGIAFDGNRSVRTGITAPAISYLRETQSGNEGLVALTGASWNHIREWLRRVDGLRLLFEVAPGLTRSAGR